MSFTQDKIASEGLTFDDVLLIPAFSEVLPREVGIKSPFTRNIMLNTPIVSGENFTVSVQLDEGETVCPEQLSFIILNGDSTWLLRAMLPISRSAPPSFVISINSSLDRPSVKFPKGI